MKYSLNILIILQSAQKFWTVYPSEAPDTWKVHNKYLL